MQVGQHMTGLKTENEMRKHKLNTKPLLKKARYIKMKIREGGDIPIVPSSKTPLAYGTPQEKAHRPGKSLYRLLRYKL